MLWGLLMLLMPLSWAQREWTPERSTRLVNDYSHVLSDSELGKLEARLVAFNDSTSNQITIVITPTLYGDDPDAVAQRIGEKWGVGQQQLGNGLVLLIKSKTEEEPDGWVAIQTGYGLEGAFPDIFCSHIINDYMINYLAEGNYYKALNEALDIIEPVAAGEYSYEQYRKDERRESIWGFVILLAIFIAIIIISWRYNKKHPGGNSGSNSGGSHGGTYFGGFPGGSWNSGGGSFSSGGFGGFGGGHFGGGGASGRF